MVKKRYTRYLIIAILIVFPGTGLLGHGGLTDPAIDELNDYLMAIQIMRFYDEDASVLFRSWDSLRIESGKIRELTDAQGLRADSREVIAQVEVTRKKQKLLLQNCRTYFSEQVKQQPALRIVIQEKIQSNWEDQILEAPIGHSTILLVEVINQRNTSANIAMVSEPSDEILFWNKQFILPPRSSRFTFVALAPLDTNHAHANLQVFDERDNYTSIQLSSRGVEPHAERFLLHPSENVTNVALPVADTVKQDIGQVDSATLKFSISDRESNEPLAVRAEIIDRNGNNLWSPTRRASFGVNRNVDWDYHTTLWDYQPGPYYYLNDGAEIVKNPAGKMVNMYHGFEYLPISQEIPEDGTIVAKLEKWIDMPDLGWYSGQTHIHTTDMGIPVQFSEVWPIVSQAEDLHVSSILTLKGEWKTHAIYSNEYPMGERKSFSTADHIITWGEEFRNDPYGHLAIIGLESLIQPISTGALGELGDPDYPPNSYFLDEALSRGAITIAAHFGVYTQGVEQIKSRFPSTGFEMPIDVALGKVKLAEIAGLGGQMEVWYDILNCGFKIPATAGPDWLIKDTPRVYVNLANGEFTLENWNAGLLLGNSFISTGSMIFFNVDGAQPGSTIHAVGGPTPFEIEVQALTPNGQIPVEIIWNGEVILETSASNSTIYLDDSGWLAARCQGAHSNPIFINFDGRPAGQAEAALKFVHTIDRLTDWVEHKAIFYNQDQKQAVLDVFDEGKNIYLGVIDQAKRLGRDKPTR